MSMFYCVDCDSLCDSDDGCEEVDDLRLICVDCAAEREAAAEEAEDFRKANPLEPGFRKLDQ